MWPLGIFVIALCSLLYNINNLIKVMIILELMLCANLVFLIVGAFVLQPELFNKLASIFPILLSTAAAEAVVGLAILVRLFRYKKSIDKKSIDKKIKG